MNNKIKEIKDKYFVFEVPLTLFNKLEGNKKNKSENIVYIKEGNAVIDKPNGVEYYSVHTSKNNMAHYPIYQKRPNFHKVVGYLPKNEDSDYIIGYCRPSTAFIIFFIFSLIITGLSALFYSCPDVLINGFFSSSSVQDESLEISTELQTIEKGNGISDMNDLLHSNASTHTLSVPQFSELYVTNGIYVPLINLPQNDILIMYKVYDDKNNIVFESSKPIKPNDEDKWYINGYAPGSYYFTIIAYKVDESGNVGNSISFNTTLYISK